MARSSPGVRRIVAVLNFFAEHPGQSFTLTDLVRALKLSRATCHALLTGLVESGYLYRTSEKAYVIGPALVALGRIANDHFSPLQVAQPEMRALADEFDVICMAVFRERNEAVVRARTAASSHLGWSMPQDARIPLRVGAIFFAWSPPAEVEAWLQQILPPPTPEQRARILDGIAFARAHGFSVGVRTVDVPVDPDARELAFHGEKSGYPIGLISEIESGKDYHLTFINAPVFDTRHQVAFVLNLTGFNSAMPGAAVERIGQRLRESCARISSFIVGKKPDLATPPRDARFSKTEADV